MSNIDLNIYRVVPKAHVSAHNSCDVLHLHVRTREYDAPSWDLDEALRLSIFFHDGKLEEGIANLIDVLNEELKKLPNIEHL